MGKTRGGAEEELVHVRRDQPNLCRGNVFPEFPFNHWRVKADATEMRFVRLLYNDPGSGL